MTWEPMLKIIDVPPSDFLYYIWFRNMNRAKSGNSCIVARTTLYLCRKLSRIITWGNLIRFFLTF